MTRPRSSGSCDSPGMSSTRSETRWFGTIEAVCENQNAESPVSTRPLSGIGVGSTTSNAEIRSEATSASSPSPASYSSRTLPEPMWASSGMGALRHARLEPAEGDVGVAERVVEVEGPSRAHPPRAPR